MKKTYYFGLFFLFIQIIVILRNYIIGYNYFFWYCDFAPLLLSISFFINNRAAVKAIINFGLIPQVIFLIDFLYITYGKMSPFGIATSLLEFNAFSIYATIFIHLTTIFALIITLRDKPDKKTLLYSISIIFFIYFITLLFTSPSGDINWVYSINIPIKIFNFSIQKITYVWTVLAFLLVVLTQCIQYFIYRLTKKNIKSYN